MILDDLPRGVSGQVQKPPKSLWYPPEQLLAENRYEYNNSKIFLGYMKGKYIGIEDDRHVMLCAGSRSGKGVSIIVPNLIEYKGSVLAIDPKGELANITAKRRAKGLGQNVYVLAPFNRTSDNIKDYRAAFNPLTLLYKGSSTIIEDAGLIADALIVPSGGDSHWDDSARNFLEGIILHIATSDNYKVVDKNLVTIRDLISGRKQKADDSGGLDFLQKEMAENAALLEHFDDDLAAALEASVSDFFEKPDNERGSVLSTLRKHTKFLDYKAMRDVLVVDEHTRTFELSWLKTAPKGTTIYLCLPAGRMATCNRWFRLFVNLALEAMERETKKPEIPVLFCLDEFPVLGHMRQIEVAAGQIAGFGVKLMTVIQDLSQLKAIYKDRWETFMGNAGLLIFFGNNDVTTLEFIQKRLGKTSVMVDRQSDVSMADKGKGGSGRSWSLEMHDLITLDEASRIFGRGSESKDRMLVIHAGEKPIILKRIRFFEEPYNEPFRGKYEDTTNQS